MKAAVYKGLNRILSRVLKTPQYVILFVSDSCWMKCSHCWFNEDWKEENLVDKSAGEEAGSQDDLSDLVQTEKVDYKQLSFDELERMADSMERIVFLTLTGGEAFMRADIVEIAEMFRRKTKLWRYQIPTSGFVPDMIVGKTERILQVNPDTPFRVDVSLDGTEDVHDRIRNRPGSYQRVLETIRGLRRLKQKNKHFDVGVITTVSQLNQHEIEAISRVAEEVNPDGEWMVNVTRGKPRDPEAKDIDPANYIAAHKLIAKRIEERRYRGHSGHASGPWLTAKNATRRKMIHDTITGKRKGGGCSAATLAAVIYSDGTVKPCELLEQSIGNIRDFDYDLARLWSSAEAKQVRNRIQDTRCICTQECFLSMDILIQPQQWPYMIGQRLKLLGASKGLPPEETTTVSPSLE